MQRHGEELDVTTTEARGGSTPHIVRWVLVISLILVVAGMSAIWIFGAATTEDDMGSGTAPEQAVLAPGAETPNTPAAASDDALPGLEGGDEDVGTVTPQ